MIWADNVPLSLDNFEDIAKEHPDDSCYRLTMKQETEKYGFDVYRFCKSCDSYILYNGKMHYLGRGSGPYGVTSLAAADLNGDGALEIYYTFSWMIGESRLSSVAYFDTASEEVVHFYGFRYYNDDLALKVEDGRIGFYQARVSLHGDNDEDLVVMVSGSKVGEFIFENGEIGIVTKQ
jgi:hypothetical protein